MWPVILFFILPAIVAIAGACVLFSCCATLRYGPHCTILVAGAYTFLEARKLMTDSVYAS